VLTLAAADTLAGVATSATTVTYTIFGDEVTTTDNYKALAQGQLAAAAATIYTVPVSTQAIVSSIVLSNRGGSAQAVTLYRGGTGAGNALASFTIPANGTATFDGETLQILDANGSATTMALATQSASGAMSATDKTKLDNFIGTHITTTQTVSVTASTGVAVTGLSLALPTPGQSYVVEADVDAVTSATSSTAVGIGLSVPPGATLQADVVGATNATAIRNAWFTAPGVAQGSFITTTGYTGPLRVKGVLTLGTASTHTGSVGVVMNAVGTASTLAATATVQAGSALIATPIS
jgi:hypothetical protein